MRIAIVVEAIPPYCGGGEQVAWVHALEMSKRHEVAVITLGPSEKREVRDGIEIYFLPQRTHNFASYLTVDRARLNRCLDRIAPEIVHCHMPNVLSAVLRKNGRILISTIHDGVPENELLKLKLSSRIQWLKFKLVRRINVMKSHAVTCVSRHNLDVMRSMYPNSAEKFCFIPNPIAEKFFAPAATCNEKFVLNFGRQLSLKMGALLDVARMMPETRFVFVGTGDMARDYGLPNVNFVGFSDAVERYIDSATICVFPSRSENFPLVGLEAMARGKPVIASQRGFSEYIEHMRDGFILDSTEPTELRKAIDLLIGNAELRTALGREARKTALNYRPANVVAEYEALYQSFGLAGRGPQASHG